MAEAAEDIDDSIKRKNIDDSIKRKRIRVLLNDAIEFLFPKLSTTFKPFWQLSRNRNTMDNWIYVCKQHLENCKF